MTEQSALVTGGAGFIGRHLVETLVKGRAGVRILARHHSAAVAGPSPNLVEEAVGDISDGHFLVQACADIDTVFHLAGYAHAVDSSDEAAAAMHTKVTVDGTKAVIAAAQEAGVKRLVFVSSVKAMGEGGPECLDEAAVPAPATAYGRAKLAAEQLVLAAGREHGMHVCNLRLPLVYGRDNKGNLPRMIAAVDRGRFPPLPEVHNKRSMVHVDDVVQALLLAAQQPEANGQTYIVTDGKIYSTHEIYELICAALGRAVPRWSVPVWALRAGARLGDIVGRLRGRPVALNSDALEKLLGSAWYSSRKIADELGYRPTRDLQSALPEMVAEYRNAAAS